MGEDLRTLLEQALDYINRPNNIDDAADLLKRGYAALAQPAAEPIAGLCPAGCGCTWRPPAYTPTVGMTFGLLGPNSKSCSVCEVLPWDRLVHVYAAPPSVGQIKALEDEVARLKAAQEHWGKYKSDWKAQADRADAAECALAGAKAKALREAAEVFDEGGSLIEAGELRRMASEHERGG
jgi:hypothetical protein